MGKHDERNNDQEKITSEGHFPDRKIPPPDEDNALVSETDIHPYQIAVDRDAAFVIGLRVPDCKTIYSPAKDDSGVYAVWFLDRVSPSWANIDYSPGTDTYPVRQWGSRHLWDEVAAAYRCWMDASRPKAEQWRFTITAK